ncbi:hypothetical protein [Bradyrhizobium sp. dw_78]|nr:hypothetical protein [Bradyrhizobium sp. dw_78]
MAGRSGGTGVPRRRERIIMGRAITEAGTGIKGGDGEPDFAKNQATALLK